MNTQSENAIQHAATGPQFLLQRGNATAIVVSLAAGLRHYERDGVALVESYDVGQTAPGASGITLAPFANRVDGGRWILDGAMQQLFITEPALDNAIHGLLRYTGYTALEATEHHVLLEAAVYPQPGYPFLVRHRVRYELDADGALHVAQTIINDSPEAAPFVLGAHPYLRIGDVAPESLTITVDAATRLAASERKIPTAAVPVDAHFDLRAGRLLPEVLMDTAFTDIAMHDGVARHTLSAPDGRSVTLWQDESAQYVHVFVTDSFPGRSLAVAVEPMTGPANAFNSGDGLRWLKEGEEFTMRWGIEAFLG